VVDFVSDFLYFYNYIVVHAYKQQTSLPGTKRRQ